MPVGIGAVTGFGDQRGGAHAVDQGDDLANRMAAMQRRAADIAVARAGEQHDGGLHPARQPHGDTLAGPYAVAGQARGHPVSGVHQLGVG